MLRNIDNEVYLELRWTMSDKYHTNKMRAKEVVYLSMYDLENPGEPIKCAFIRFLFATGSENIETLSIEVDIDEPPI